MNKAGFFLHKVNHIYKEDNKNILYWQGGRGNRIFKVTFYIYLNKIITYKKNNREGK